MGPIVLTVRDVASYLNVGEKTIYRLALRGDLPGFKVAGTWRFRQVDIDTWIEQRKAQAATGEAAGDGRRASTRRRSTGSSKGRR